MKKTIITSMALATLSAGVFLYSCKKEGAILEHKTTPSLPQAKEVTVSVKDNLLVFKTKDDYRSIADNPLSEQRIKFVENVKNMDSFSSYYKYFSAKNPSVLTDSSAINNDFLQTILNNDAAVQIGNYIYKIDKANEKVFALNTAYADQYSDVVSGNTANPNVRAFSTGDEVLRLTGNNVWGKGEGVLNEEEWPSEGGGGGGGGGGYTCETGISDQYAQEVFSYNGNNGVVASAAYDRFGIYFSLYALIDGVPPSASVYDFDFTGGIPANAGYVYYAKRQQCNTPVSYPILDPGIYKDANTQEYPSYQGSRSLNEVYFYFRVKHKYTYTYFTNYIGFRQNK